MTKSNWTLAGRLRSKNRPVFAVLLALLFAPAAFSSTDLKVARITFTGNRSFSEKDLKSILKSEEKKDFNPRFLRLDQILITNYYIQQGYLDVYVTSSFDKEENRIFIEYQLKEGNRYFLNGITFSGNSLFSSEELRKAFKIKDGQAYKRSEIENGLNNIESMYLDNGKPYVLFSDRERISSDSLITVEIQLQEGQTVIIEDLEYEGLQLVKSFLIRRELEIKKGDVFSRRKIEASQKNIYSTGLFKLVNYRLSPVGDDLSRVKLVWRLAEKKALWVGLRFGVGYENGDAIGNVTTFDLTAEGGHRNIFGTARSFSLRFVTSLFYGRENPDDAGKRILNPRDQYSFSFVEPWVLETRTPGVFNITYSRQRKPISVVPLNMLAASFNLSHQFKNYWSYTAGISYQQVNIEEEAGVNVDSLLQQVSQGQDKIYALNCNPVKDRRDNILIPQNGYQTEIRNRFVYSTSRLNISTAAAGIDTTVTNVFYKAIVQWSRYQPFLFNRKWTLASRLRASGLLEFGGRKYIEFIPTTERFYLGGASTIRGYAEQSIGRERRVLNPDGSVKEVNPIGGKYALLGNAELRIPLFWLFYGEIFTDIGNLWEEIEDMKSLSLKVSSGMGLAVATPFGPIRFDYGLKWFPKKGESRGEFHIGISFAF